MKRFLVFLAIAVFILNMFVGCNNKGKDKNNTTNSSNETPSQLSSEELKEWWGNVSLEIEEGDGGSQNSSTTDSSSGNTSSNTNSGNTNTSSSATSGGIDISGGSNNSSSTTNSTTGTQSSNPAPSEPEQDETLDNESYVPTEKDEGFGEWV